MLDLTICFNWTPRMEWCMVKRESMNIYHIDMCLKWIGLCAQIMFGILGQTIKKNGETYMIISYGRESSFRY